MERIKRVARRVVLVVGLFVGTAVVCDRPARAQFAVTDLPQIGVHITNYATQLLKFLEQLGITKEEYEWLYDIYDVAMGMGDFIKDIGMEVRLVKSLERQTEQAVKYVQRLTEMEASGYNLGMIQSMKSRVERYLKTLNKMLDQAMKILADTGLTKGEKVEKTKEMTETIIETGNKMSDDMATELYFLDATRSNLQFENFICGDPADQDLDNAAVDVDPLVDDNTDYGIGDAFEAGEQEEMRSVAKSGFKTVYLVLGILLALSLIGIMVRFMRGDSGSEVGFVRIFVVIVVAAVLFTVLHGVMRL